MYMEMVKKLVWWMEKEARELLRGIIWKRKCLLSESPKSKENKWDSERMGAWRERDRERESD